jgi:hypothetical protein
MTWTDSPEAALGRDRSSSKDRAGSCAAKAAGTMDKSSIGYKNLRVKTCICTPIDRALPNVRSVYNLPS